MELLHTSFKFKIPFHNLIQFIIFTISIAQTPSADSNSWDCLPQNCGNGPNISYPFWIPHQQEPYCGSPGFNVTCSNRNPILRISGDDYIVRDVFYANRSFLLASARVYDASNSCPVPVHNFSLDRTPFLPSPSFWDLSFYYNCTAPAENYETYSVDCASNATRHSFAVYHSEVLKFRNYSIESCQSLVTAPMDGDDIEKLLEMNFTGVLKKGFVLQWNGVDCRNCERSGGVCGSYGDGFICFCNNHPHRKTCRDGKRIRQVFIL